jgi:hypothetical protein
MSNLPVSHDEDRHELFGDVCKAWTFATLPVVITRPFGPREIVADLI